MKLSQRQMGFILMGFAVILLVVLALVKADIDRKDAFLCEASAYNPNIDMAECPAHTSNVSWLLVVAFGISFLILGAGTYMVIAPSGTKGIRKAMFKLSADEKKVYNAVKSSEGSIYQSDLIKETGFSKVKVTRVLDKMEGKGILEKKRRGMTNIVVLK